MEKTNTRKISQTDTNGGDSKHLKAAEFAVSRSTGRRYNEVVHEFVKNKLGKSDSSESNIPPSQVLTSHSDQAGPEEGSYVCWESPDTPRSQKPIKMTNHEDSEGTASIHSSGKPNPRSSSKFSSSASGMDSFRTADPFSPGAKNVVRLSDSSMQSPWNDSYPFNSSDGGTSKSSGTRKGSDISPASNASKPGSDVITVFPKCSVFPSPDRNTHGAPLTTFSRVDGAKNDSYTSILLQTPTSPGEQDISKEKNALKGPHTPSIRLTSVKGSSHNLFEGSFCKDPPSQQGECSDKNPDIDKDNLLSPALVALTERTKSRHPMGNNEGDHDSTDSLELTGSSFGSKENKQKSPTGIFQVNDNSPSDKLFDDSRGLKTSDDDKSFYSPPDTSLQPNTLDFDNISGKTTDSRKKYKTPLSSGWPYPPEEADVNSYTINVSTPPRSFTSSRSSLHPKGTSSCHGTEGSDFHRNQTAREKSFYRRERFGWCLVVFGSLLLISCVIAILAIEIPAHRGEVIKVIPDSQALVSYLNFSEFQGFILPAAIAGNASEIFTSTPVSSEVTFLPYKKPILPDGGEKDKITDSILSIANDNVTYTESPHADKLIGVIAVGFSTESSSTESSTSELTTELPTIPEGITEVAPDNLRTKIPALEPLQNYSTAVIDNSTVLPSSTSDAKSNKSSVSTHVSTAHVKDNVGTGARTEESITTDGASVFSDKPLPYVITKEPVITSVIPTEVPSAAVSVISNNSSNTVLPTDKPIVLGTNSSDASSLTSISSPTNNLLLLTEVNNSTHQPVSSVGSSGSSSGTVVTNNFIPTENLTIVTSINSVATVMNSSTNFANLTVNPRKIEIISITSDGSSIAEDFTSDSSITHQSLTTNRDSAASVSVAAESSSGSVFGNNYEGLTSTTSSVTDGASTSGSSIPYIAQSDTLLAVTNGSLPLTGTLPNATAVSTINDLSPHSINNVTSISGVITENSTYSPSHTLGGLGNVVIALNVTNTPGAPRTTTPLSADNSTQNIHANGTTTVLSPVSFEENATRSTLSSVVTGSAPVTEKGTSSPAVNGTSLPSIQSSVSSTEKSAYSISVKDVQTLASSTTASTVNQSVFIKLPMPVKDMNPQNIFGIVRNISGTANPTQKAVTKALQPAGTVDKDFLPARPSWLDYYFKYRKSKS